MSSGYSRVEASGNVRLFTFSRRCAMIAGCRKAMYRSVMPKTKPRGWLKRVLWFLCRVWLVCGLVTSASGIGFAVYTSFWMYRSVSGQGTVIDLVPQTDGDGTISYSARFQFRAQDGEVCTAMAGVATNPPSFAVGETVRVRYIPHDPRSAKLSYFWQLWFEPVLCAGLGVLFTGAGCLLLRHERRNSPQTPRSSTSPAAALH